MKLSLGFSPCPNDTFIFDALVNGHVDTKGLTFDVHLADVEQLNSLAAEGTLDITKLSYHAYAYLLNDYNLLSAGSALGNNCGPLLIGKKQLSNLELEQSKIAIPGSKTTANFLLKYYKPNITNKALYLFSEIEAAVLNDEVEAGVIIHENRFTYAEKGLVKIKDLGEHWETETGFPIPLGGIVANKRLPLHVQQTVNSVLRESIEWAFQQKDLSEYVKSHAQEMSETVMRQHINLYVNDFTKKLGESGKAAIGKMFEIIGEEEMPLVIE